MPIFSVFCLFSLQKLHMRLFLFNFNNLFSFEKKGENLKIFATAKVDKKKVITV